MTSKCAKLIIVESLWFLLIVNLTQFAEAVNDSEEYCLLESFSPRCLKNEVIFIKSALFGRMRVGRCITAEEVSGLGPIVGEDPRYLGCSEDVLPFLDQKCSGNKECEVRVGDISGGNIKPCFPGLSRYLEVSYACLSIADEERSCTVTASKNPVHIIGSLSSLRMCGTKSQPWVVEASTGKRVSLTLLKVIVPPATSQMEEQSRQSCYSRGVIVDKAGKRNASICGDGVQREKSLYLSSGNTVDIIFGHSTEKDAADAGRLFILKVEAVGCSDIIPPEDAWLKRNSDAIVIGCYSNRQTWRLTCDDGKWIGVLGNCSQDNSVIHESVVELESRSTISPDEQILALIAIVGCTLAVCLAIMCIGAVCLRRYHTQSKKKQAYKTLNYQINTARSQTTDPRFLSGGGRTDLAENSGHFVGAEQMPTYSVYVGDGEFHDVSVNTNSSARL